ncbi:redoxin domain-containing protein [Alteromonas sp. ALT199]|uniref:peroxiredoxin family protein n=1 Tax=unclassified Alteromonas TaxID=2614992 RepID=UPI001BEC7EF8|nr:redoxin domain-containing protein [Alteromonas sp. ALT199]MBT3134392.1 redoxin domain-containing protein [Alteromonas sp. ALT199]
MSEDILLSLVGFLTTAVGAVLYFAKVKKRRTPKVPVLFITALAIGSLLSTIAIILTVQSLSSGSLLVFLMSAMPLMMTTVFFVTFKEAKPPLGNLQVKVGDKVPQFQAKNIDGTVFDANHLIGQRTLLKFFRGSWCPYCSTELQMFEEMKPVFDEYNVNIIAISNDDIQSAKKHQERDHLSHTLLSDPELTVIRQFGVEHHKALGGESASSKTFFGLPFPMMMKYKPMAIPTTLLIDEEGIIRWIDQAEDVRLRANEFKLKEALKTLVE